MTYGRQLAAKDAVAAGLHKHGDIDAERRAAQYAHTEVLLHKADVERSAERAQAADRCRC